METLNPFTTLHELLTSRRSIHHFDDRPVPRSVLKEALAAGVYAPNHRLSEPWRFYVAGPEAHDAIVQLNTALVREKQGDAAAENKRARWQAVPGFLVVTYKPDADALRAREDYAACACAVQNILLSLWSQGVGTKWTTGPVTRDARLLQILGADTGEEVVGLIHFGFPADVPTTLPRTAETRTRWLT